MIGFIYNAKRTTVVGITIPDATITNAIQTAEYINFKFLFFCIILNLYDISTKKEK